MCHPGSMDTLTHALSGALLARATLGRAPQTPAGERVRVAFLAAGFWAHGRVSGGKLGAALALGVVALLTCVTWLPVVARSLRSRKVVS